MMGIYDSGANSPVDYQLQQAKIDRQRLIAQELVQKGLTPAQGQMVSGHYTGGLGAIIGQIGAAINGSRMMDQADSDAATLGQNYSSGLSSALNNYLTTKVGKSATPDQSVPTDGLDVAAGDQNEMTKIPGDAAVPPNARKAAIEALSSQFKPLQSIGNSDLAILAKNDPFDQAMQAYQAKKAAGQSAGALGGTGVSGVATPNMATPTGGAAPATPATPAPALKGIAADQDPENPLTHFFPNLGNSEAQSLILTDPTRASAAKANAERGNATPDRGFGIVQWNPVTHSYDTMTDPAKVAGGIEAAKVNAQNQGSLTEYKDANGNTVNLSKAQLLALTGQSPAGSPPQQELYQGQGLLNQLPADMRQKILASAAANDTPQFNLNIQHPVTGQRISGPINLAGPPVSASPNGAQIPAGSVTPIEGNSPSPATPSTPGFKSGITPSAENEQKGLGSAMAEQSAKLDDAANTAMTIKARVAQMRTDSQNFTGGSLTDLKSTLGGLAIGLGADPDAVASKIGNVADMQSFNKEALSLAFDQVKTLGSREAMGVVTMALKANAGLTTQPDATGKIMSMIDGMADFTLAKQQGEQLWKAQHNGSRQGFEATWNAQNPITKYVDVSSLRMQPQGAKASQPPITPALHSAPAAAAPAGWSIKRIN